MIKISKNQSENFIKDELEKSHEEIRRIDIHLQNAREENRSKFARELHDDTGQLLTILKLEMQFILNEKDSTKESIIEKVKNSIVIIDEVINITRKIISELRLAILDHLGLVPALEHLVDEFKERNNSKVEYDFEKDIKLNKNMELHLFQNLSGIINKC